MIRTVIIDDEERSINVLATLIKDYCPELIVKGTATDARKAIELIKHEKPDLLFLDIMMPDLNGFDILAYFNDPDFKVVFVTAYDHYAIKAIQYVALDYILKPVGIEQLKNVVALYQKRSAHENEKLLALKENKRQLNKLAIPTAQGFDLISTDQIIWLEASESYTIFHLTNKRTIISSYHLKKFEELLESNLFLRIHHSHMVNLNHVHKYFRNKNAIVLMSEGYELEVSQRKKDSLLQLLQYSVW